MINIMGFANHRSVIEEMELIAVLQVPAKFRLQDNDYRRLGLLMLKLGEFAG